MEILRRLDTADLQANYQNLLRLLPAKKKWLWRFMLPCGYDNVAIWHIKSPLPLFSLTPEAQREKLTKEKCRYMGRRPKPRKFLEKLD